ncbi:MAG: hypothetical protein AAFV71_25245 [Cyanobacteria bacterium J06633_8]
MIIQDLGILDLANLPTNIIGGVRTTAIANTRTGRGIADSDAEAVALGKITKTVTTTSTYNREDNLSSSSRASARARSSARDGKRLSRSSETSNSFRFRA